MTLWDAVLRRTSPYGPAYYRVLELNDRENKLEL